ncbi:MAG: hypothetical protein JXJ18_04020 [Rhodobacteraceae bacterium]|nr:hypothetical protein [Paracoccaceae bacterium]
MTRYIWDDWLPKLASKDRVLTDMKFDGSGSVTPFSDMLGFKLLSENKSRTELMTDNPTPLSKQMNWPLLNETPSKTELKTSDPTPLSSRMGWALLSDRAYYAESV